MELNWREKIITRILSGRSNAVKHLQLVKWLYFCQVGLPSGWWRNYYGNVTDL